MKDRYQELLSLLISGWQAGRLYSPEHPQFLELLERVYRLLLEILKEIPKLTLALVGEDIVIGEEIRVDQSERLNFFFQGLRERSIERLTFYQGLAKEELVKFMAFISLPQKRSEEDLFNFFQLEGISHIEAGKLKASLKPEEEWPRFNFPRSYQKAVQLLASLALKLNQQESISLLELRYLALSIAENFSGNYWEILRGWPALRPEERLWAHLLNTSLLVMTATSRLGFSKEDWLDLGVASLFHDLGKAFTFEALSFSGESHPVIGARLLSRYRDSLSPLPSVVALEHHLRFDLKGQPRLKGINEPHEASQIVSIANVYEHLLRKRAYDDRFNPKFVYEIMMAEKGKAFSPYWLEQFFSVMGVWREGSQVLLNDGRKGQVVRQNKNQPYRPKVEVVLFQGGTEIIDLSSEKTIEIIESFNPFSSTEREALTRE